MNVTPIKDKTTYRQALKAIEGLMRAQAGTPEGDRLDVLVTLVEAWERQHYPMDLPDAIEAIKFHMEQQGLTVTDLASVIGRANRVYEVLARTRPLTLRMIEGLHTRFGIPAESLLKQSRVAVGSKVSARKPGIGAKAARRKQAMLGGRSPKGAMAG